MLRYFTLLLVAGLAMTGCGTQAPATNNAANSTPASATTPAANSAPASNASNAANPTPHASPTHTETTDKDGNKKVNVHFAAGKSEGTYSNSFAGYGYVDYEFKASKGQKLTTDVKSDGNDAILGVMRNDLMVAPGSVQVQEWSGELPEDGTYVIRVGQMRAEARRSEKPKNFTLRIKID